MSKILDFRICNDHHLIRVRAFDLEENMGEFFMTPIGTPAPGKTLLSMQSPDNRVNKILVIHTKVTTIPIPWECHLVVGGDLVFRFFGNGREGAAELKIKDFYAVCAPSEAQALRSGMTIQLPDWGRRGNVAVQH